MLKWVLDWGPEQRESKMTVLCPLIIIILINKIIIYYIIIRLLIMENHPRQNWKWNSCYKCCLFLQHLCYLDICGSSRQLFSCIGVYYLLLYCSHFLLYIFFSYLGTLYVCLRASKGSFTHAMWVWQFRWTMRF